MGRHRNKVKFGGGKKGRPPVASTSWPLRGLLLDAFAGQEVAQLAGARHLAHDVAAADEFALHIELRDGRPLGEILDPLADGGIGQHVHAFEFHAEVGQHLHDGGGESALREDGRALHEEQHVVFLDVLLDAVDYRVGHSWVLWVSGIEVIIRYFGAAVCSASAWSWSPILPRRAW